MGTRATLLTQNAIAGVQRKLAWFDLRPRGLYFDVGGLLFGSHMSYHVDGNVFRTSPATFGKAIFQERMIPLNKFRGWHQFGTAMMQRKVLANNPAAKGRDKRLGAIFAEVDVEAMPASCLNIVLEVVHRLDIDLVSRAGLGPPPNSVESRFELGNFIILLTTIGYKDELLISPSDSGVTAHHWNERFSANRKGVTYHYEAYG